MRPKEVPILSRLLFSSMEKSKEFNIFSYYIFCYEILGSIFMILLPKIMLSNHKILICSYLFFIQDKYRKLDNC